MELISQCALRVAKLVWRPGHGGFAFTLVCKATFELSPDLSPFAAQQEPVTEADVYTGPERASLARASDLVPFKQRPEVLLTGHAYAPDGEPVPSLVARIAVGEIYKSIQVEGDRYFDLDGWITEPEPFARMPLVWERAAGGPGTANPAGVALNADARPDAFGRIPAPNLLPQGTFLTSRRKVVPPLCFGPIAPLWMARASFLHRHAARWDPDRWNEGPLPADVDVAYFNAAPPDQQRAEPFGDEPIYLENLHPRFAQLSTRLAPVSPAATVDRGSGPEPLRLRCDTLVFDTDRGLAMLVWRAHVLLDHPDRPGRVVVTGPAAPEPSFQGWGRGSSGGDSTIAPTQALSATEALPFQGGAPPPDPPPLRRATAILPFMRSTATLDPSQLAAVSAPALPFSEAAPEPPTAAAPDVTMGLSDPPASSERARDVLPFMRRTATLDPSQLTAASAPVLPFAEAPKSSERPLGGGMVLSRPAPPPAARDEDATFVGPAPHAPTLPFTPSSRAEPPATRDEDLTLPGVAVQIQALPFDDGAPPSRPLPPPISAPAFVPPAEIGPPAFAPSPEHAAPAFVPSPESGAPAPVFVLESTASAPGAPADDPERARIRLVQQAIWRGDRPTRQILAEYGLTEIEWRAMKRASARKASV